jgi:hypothetical protein
MFFRLSEARLEDATVTKAALRGGLVHGFSEIETELLRSPSDYYQFDWVRPRLTWLEATCPVYIDFGGDRLIKLEIYDESGLRCIRILSKKKFVHDALVEESAHSIATNFYRITS